MPEANAAAPKASLSIIRRDDGSKQYAFKDKPLYYWKNNQKAGDATGHGVNNVWAVAKNWAGVPGTDRSISVGREAGRGPARRTPAFVPAASPKSIAARPGGMGSPMPRESW